MSACFHCGLPAVDSYTAEIDGKQEKFCCVACQTVAVAIDQGGLVDFYRYRDSKNIKAEESSKNFDAFDVADVQSEFVYPIDQNLNEVQLLISGISCAACAWLIEKRLSILEGVQEVSVNATNYRCRVVWDSSKSLLSEVFSALAEIGFQASPYTESHLNTQRKKESRGAMMRLGVAGIGMMQVGMFAIALHAGALQGMEEQWRGFFRFVSFIVATPVVLYSAQSFFINAWHSLKAGRLTMDVPVALAIGLAYIASIYATLNNSGEVYFDSISMFTFFLLLGRYVEMKVRHSSAFASERMSQLLPVTVEVVKGSDVEAQPISALSPGQVIQVSAGMVIPCDGEVVDGQSSVNESVLTGESKPLLKKIGDKVSAGSINGESRLLLRVEATGKNTRLASIERLVDKATTEKPKIVTMADRFSRYFVAFVLLAAFGVGVYWYLNDPQRAIWIVLSVLVATCPCALSLATPAAVTAGINTLRMYGLLVTSAQFVEKFPTINAIVFDKTGTLTRGLLSIKEVKPIGDANKDVVLSLIAAMERGSKHPIASAFSAVIPKEGLANIKVVPGKGISAEYDGDSYRFGVADYAVEGSQVEYPGDGIWCLLSRDNQAHAWVLFEDVARENIGEVKQYFSGLNISSEILSGDRQENVQSFADTYQLPFLASQGPENKFERIQSLQKQNKRVLMLGDGINDVPVLSAADLSIAVGDATRLAQTHADAVLTSGDLAHIVTAHKVSLRTKAKIKQNLTWAFLYNFSILPAAAMGYVPPWAAAIGMSLSSLLVVLNSLTVQFYKSPLKITS